MSREVRLNLIFLVCLVFLCAPGFIILINRKLNGTSTSTNAVPDAVHTTIAYNQPQPAPPLRRAEPGIARQWVTSIVAARAGATAATDLSNIPLNNPIMSDTFVTQFVAMSVDGKSNVRVSVLRWDDGVNFADHAPPKIEVDFAGGPAALTTNTAEPIDVPRDVRHALQDVGYIDPPAHVWWIGAVGKTDGPPGAPRQLRLSTVTAAGKPITETMTFPPAFTPATTEPTP